RVRINCQTTDGAVRSLLLGFIPGEATDGIDIAYDAENTDGLANDFSWLIEEKYFSTQGVGEFEPKSQYPIIAMVGEAGEINISLLAVENFDYDLEVFIYDALYGTYTNLNTTDFVLSLDAGIHRDRFYLAFYELSTLSDSENELGNILINYLNDSNEIYVHIQDAHQIDRISIVNIIGQEVQSYERSDFDVNGSNEIRIPVKSIAEGTYVLKVESDLGTANKKVIIQY
ncbi:MAG: T9SS type A sorting domain-containing protein, partial [Bacteroidia bacterium]|nr:T9SS type A sorting domain-containing protein [Bacteroidia bacterium]